MTQARERRARRVMPPPRHPVPAGNADPIEADSDQPAVAKASTEPLPAADQHPIAATKSQKQAKPAATAEPAATEAIGEQAPPRPATLYLDNNLWG